MCGICGWISWGRPPDPEIVSSMADRLKHRGPDAGNVVRSGGAALGHRRLAVIDTGAQANQPMADSTGRHWIVYNGETYNFKTLRGELEAKGIRFKTRSDTEVVVEAYKAWGPNCVKRFNGMFALAIWDSQERTLFLARDRLGKKPLFWSRTTSGDIVFASEIKSLRAHPSISLNLNPAAVGQYLSLNYVLGGTPIFAGVNSLEPGTFILTDGSAKPVPVSYWNLAQAFRSKRAFKSENHAAEELRALIDDAVACRLVSDVPVGIFLSGGIDSAAIAASIRLRCLGDCPHAFSIGFKEKSYDESEDARAMAAHLNIPHHEWTADLDLAETLPRMVYFADSPFADSSFFPTYRLAEFARKQVTVALSGDGGDELFCGYETYGADRIRACVGKFPDFAIKYASHIIDRYLPVSFNKVSFDYKLRKFLRGVTLEPDTAHYFWRTIFEPEGKRRLLRRERLPDTLEDGLGSFLNHAAAVADCDLLDRAMYVDIKTWLADDILLKLDRTTMAHSLEARTPLLDYRVVEFAASLPTELKLKYMTKKYLLKKSQRGRIPAAVLRRKKRGFGAPVSHWLRGPLRQLAEDATRDRVLDDWFKPSAVDKLWSDHDSKREDNGLKLMGMTNFSIWLDQTRNDTLFPASQPAAPTKIVTNPKA